MMAERLKNQLLIAFGFLAFLGFGCSEQKSPEAIDSSGFRNEGSFLSDARPQEIRSPEEMLSRMTPEEQNLTVMNALVFGITAFRCHAGRFPTEEEGLAILTIDSSDDPFYSQGPYSEPRYLYDPWGNPYEYLLLDDSEDYIYDIRSLGPDGVESEDDISFLSHLPESRQFSNRVYMEGFLAEYKRQSRQRD